MWGNGEEIDGNYENTHEYPEMVFLDFTLHERHYEFAYNGEKCIS